jgi:hypothetical protein
VNRTSRTHYRECPDRQQGQHSREGPPDGRQPHRHHPCSSSVAAENPSTITQIAFSYSASNRPHAFSAWGSL